MKLKTQLTVAALALLTALIAAACSQAPPVDQYPTFAQAMDQLAGPGRWTAATHTNGKDGLLTVSELTITLPGLVPPLPESGEPAEAEPDGSEARTIEIATVELKKPLDQKTLENLIATADWRDQKETRLADSVVLKGVKISTPMGRDPFEFTVEEAAVKAPVLSASGPEAPAGRAGFFKALRLDELTYKNAVSKASSLGTEVVATIGLTSIQNVSFDGEAIAGMEALDPTGLFGIMSAMATKSASTKDTVVEFKTPDNELITRVTVSSIEQKDTKAMGAIGDLTVDGIKVAVGGEKTPAVNFALAKLNMRGFDMSAYLKRMMPVLVTASFDPDRAEQMMTSFYTLGDFFAPPFSLDEASLNGLDINIADIMTIKADEAWVSGSYRAGQIPAGQKSGLKGLEIVLPQDAKKVAENPDFQKIYEFGQKFGMTRFVINSESEGSYNPETGQVLNRLTGLSVTDLMEITGSSEMSGLTPERMEKLSSTPLSMITLALMAPDAVFGDVAIHKLNLKLEDQGLTNRVLGYIAQTRSEEGPDRVSTEDVRQQVLVELAQALNRDGHKYLANHKVLIDALTAFFTKPGSLELNLAADPPLGAKSIVAGSGDANQLLDSLNISVSANGEESPALKFAIYN